jgi:hypothetical protein
MDYTAPMPGRDDFVRDSYNCPEVAAAAVRGGRTQEAFGATLSRLPRRYADPRSRRGRSLLNSWVPTTRNTPGR